MIVNIYEFLKKGGGGVAILLISVHILKFQYRWM
jgi:hypothetical protein